MSRISTDVNVNYLSDILLRACIVNISSMKLIWHIVILFYVQWSLFTVKFKSIILPILIEARRAYSLQVYIKYIKFTSLYLV